MAMTFTPKSEAALVKEDEERNTLWPKGEYDFQVKNYEDAVSKTGNDMIHLLLKVFHPEGGSQTIHDYLMPQMMHKLRHACEAIGGVGKVMLKVDKAKPNSGYRDKNSVDDYVKPVARAAGKAAMAGASPAERRERAPKKSQAEIDDEIPF